MSADLKENFFMITQMRFEFSQKKTRKNPISSGFFIV